jgi:hypothetical protein
VIANEAEVAESQDTSVALVAVTLQVPTPTGVTTPVVASTVQMVEELEVANVTAPVPLPPEVERVRGVASELVIVVLVATTVRVAWVPFAMDRLVVTTDESAYCVSPDL